MAGIPPHHLEMWCREESMDAIFDTYTLYAFFIDGWLPGIRADIRFTPYWSGGIQNVRIRVTGANECGVGYEFDQFVQVDFRSENNDQVFG